MWDHYGAMRRKNIGIHRETAVDLVKKGELRGHKKTLTRTSALLVERDSVLDFDLWRRTQTGAQVG
jgi:hypothetical protein